jgi:hypothetical protein
LSVYSKLIYLDRRSTRKSMKSATANSSQEYTAAVTLKNETPIESRNTSDMPKPRILNALIVLGSMSMLIRRELPEAYHHTELSSSLVMARLPA